MFSIENAKRYLEKRRSSMHETHYVLLSMFIDDLAAENQAPHSIYTAAYRVYQYLRYLEEKGKTIENASIIDAKAFLASKKNETTRHRVAAAIKRFYRFLYQNIDPRYKEIYEKIKVKKPRNYPVPEIPPTNTVKKIIEHLKQPYKSILAIAYETGARISEILDLRLRDIEDKEDYIRITIRNSKSEQRVVYLVEYRNTLLEWLKQHIFQDNPNEYLFYSPQTLNRPIQLSSVHMAIRRVKNKLGINTRITPHLLRHLRATELYYKYRLKEREIMKLMGWKTRTMIDIYVKTLGDPDLEEKYLTIVYGLENKKEQKQEHIQCPRCHTRNPTTANYCWRCGHPLNTLAAHQLDKERQELEQKTKKLLQLLQQYPELLKLLEKEAST